MSDDFWDGFVDLISDLFGAIGAFWVGLGTLIVIFLGYCAWWEWIR